MAREMKDSGVAWIGEIPAEWDVKRMRHILCSNDGGIWGDDPLNDGTDKIVLRSTEQTVDGQWSIINPATRSLIAVDYSKYRISPGDLLITKSSGSGSHIGKTTIADSTFSVGEYYYSNFIQRIRISDSNPTFVWYLLNSPITREQFVYLQNSTSGIGNINADMIQNIYVPIPPIIEQEKIVTFLNRKCAELDVVLEKTRTSIEEYKKLKQAIITQAVTKGVQGDRPMKESGIDWASMIPSEWESVNPKALFSQRKEKAAPGERQLTSSQKYGIVYQDDYMELTGSRVVVVQKDFDILKHVEAGDFIISMRSFQGGLEYSTKTGSISSAYVMLVPNLNLVYPRFYRWLLKSEVYIRALQRTSNMVRDGQAMRYSNFAQVRLYTVPLQEQMEIADYLDGKCAMLDALIERKEKFVSEIESYKKSLIYEYVTGKKEAL